MLKKLAKAVLKYPVVFLVIIIAITVFFLQFFPRLRINSDITTMLPSNSKAVETEKEIGERFGGANFVIAMVESDDIFNSRTLRKIDAVSAEFKDLADVSEILGITRMDEIKGTEMGLEVKPIREKLPQTKAEIESFRRYLLGDKRYRGIFVSPDSKYTVVITRLSSAANESEVAESLEKIIAKYQGPEKIYLLGPPFITRTLQGYLIKDLRILLPVAAGLIVLVLYFSFGTLPGVLLPLLTVGLSTIWTMGLIGWLNEPLTLITTILPVILFSVGTAYALHIIARYDEEIINGLEKKEALEKAISSTGVPVFLAAITTVFGFVSNLFTSLRPIKVFGLASAFGVVISFLLALIFVPVILLWFPKPRIREKTGKTEESRIMAGFLKALSGIVARRKTAIVIVMMLLMAFMASAIPRITTESNFVQYFKKGSGIRTAHDIMDERFGGTFGFDIVIKGDILDPAVMGQIEKFGQALGGIENVNYPQSIADVLKDANKALNEGDPKYEVLPQTREAAAQIMLLMSMSSSSFLNNLITADYREAHITARVSSVRTKLLKKAIKQVQEAAAKCFEPGTEVVVSGTPLIIDEVQKLLISNQFSSLIAAFISVILIITLIYRTPTSGAFASMPIFLTVIMILGIMGWLGIPLDMANTMCGSIAVGIGIDYSCHFFARYKEERKKGATRSQGVESAIRSVGAPIFYNAIAVGLGFLVLMFSSFDMLGMFGKLIAIAMLFSSLGALTVLPVLILIKGKVKGEI